jgi:uncharacterized protein (TIGR00369 family)
MLMFKASSFIAYSDPVAPTVLARVWHHPPRTARSPPMSPTPPRPEVHEAPEIPAGFVERRFGDGFIGVNGPLYARRIDGGVQLGFRVERRHCNMMGICHGGMMATFCDMLLPISAHVLSTEIGNRFLPTINLQIDFLATTPLGAWVQGQAQLLRSTRSLVFMQGLVHADDVPVARVSGIFKIGPPFDDATSARVP